MREGGKKERAVRAAAAAWRGVRVSVCVCAGVFFPTLLFGIDADSDGLSGGGLDHNEI